MHALEGGREAEGAWSSGAGSADTSATDTGGGDTGSTDTGSGDAGSHAAIKATVLARRLVMNMTKGTAPTRWYWCLQAAAWGRVPPAGCAA